MPFIFLLHQALRGEHMLDLGSTDAMRQTAECAMRAGMRIAADDSHARQRRTLLRPDHMHDALPLVEEREIDLRTEFLDVCIQGLDLQTRDRVLDTLLQCWVGVLWSAVATTESMRQGLRPASFNPSKACGLVTSCTRWRSM